MHTLIWDNFWTYAYQVAIKLAHNGERGFYVLLPGPCDDNPNFNDKYKGAILVETLCRLAYIADPFEISRVAVTRASELGGLPPFGTAGLTDFLKKNQNRKTNKQTNKNDK